MKVTNQHRFFETRHIAETSKAIARALERLSTGRRVNSPRDGVVDFNFVERVNSQIRGLYQGIQNINQGLGLVNTAHQALSSQFDILQRIREIAVEGSNSTLTNSERKTLNSELLKLLEDFNQISSQTEFNNIHLLDGKFETTKIHGGASVDDFIDLNIRSSHENEIIDKIITEGSSSTTFDGDYTNNQTIAGATNLQDMLLADVDNDNDLDLISRRSNVNADIRIFENNGEGTFTQTNTIVVPVSSGWIQAGDFDNDGNVDIIETRFGTEAYLHLGNGDGSFEAVSTISLDTTSAGTVAIADINNDNDLDLIVADRITGALVYAYLGDGTGSFSLSSSRSVGTYARDIHAGDFNNDGNIDYVVGHRNQNTLSISLGNGDGTFSLGATLYSDHADDSRELAVGDVNNDGYDDILATSSDVPYVFINLSNGDGSFASATTYSVGLVGNNGDIQVGDLDGDGNLDFVVGDDTGIQHHYLGDGTGTFSFSQTLSSTLTTAKKMAISDVNGDGILDILQGDNDEFDVYLANTTTAETPSSSERINVLSQSSSENTLDILDTAIQRIIERQGEVSAIHSRFEHSKAHNLLMSESLEKSRSVILDTDYVLEIADLVQNQILQQVQVGIQAQANVQMQIVLQLLNFN